MDKTIKTLHLLYDAEVDPEYCSPNFVASFAEKLDIKLTSDDVVFVSDVYGTSQCPTGRQTELEYKGE